MSKCLCKPDVVVRNKWSPKGLLLGPLLFLFSVHDLPERLRSYLNMFAYEAKIDEAEAKFDEAKLDEVELD